MANPLNLAPCKLRKHSISLISLISISSVFHTSYRLIYPLLVDCLRTPLSFSTASPTQTLKLLPPSPPSHTLPLTFQSHPNQHSPFAALVRKRVNDTTCTLNQQ